MDNIQNTNNEDLKIVESVKIDKIYLRINKEITYEYSYIYYPLLMFNNINIIDYKIDKHNKLYFKVSFKMINILLKSIKIRRKKE